MKKKALARSLPPSCVRPVGDVAAPRPAGLDWLRLAVLLSCARRLSLGTARQAGPSDKPKRG